MYIWLIAENWPPRVGGIENYLTGIASHIQEGSITVFAPSETADSKEDESYVIRKRFSWKPLWPAWLPLFLSLKKLALTKKPDVIICGKALVEGRIANLLKKSLGIPYVVCTYGMEIATWSTAGRVRQQLETVLQNADAVLYINEKTKQELLGLGVSENNLVALYPGIDTQKLSVMSDSDAVLKKYNITKPYVLSVARLVERKGIDDLIHAFTNLAQTDTQLVIAGDGPERTSLEKIAGDNIVFLGKVSDEELHALYANATIFALTPKELPGDYEGFGIVYIEAAFFGVPVIGTRTGGVPEAIQENVTGLIAEPGNIPSIQDALHKLLKDPTIAKQYGQAGKERVIKEFTWNTGIVKLNSLLERITS